MATVAESSSVTSKDDKPVLVRVKRKAFQSRLDAFWLEINERPIKRPLLDFGKLSISDSSSNIVDEFMCKRVLVQHLETVSGSVNTNDVLRYFVSDSANVLKCKGNLEEKRCIMRTSNKQDKLMVKAKQMQEVLSSNARYEQIWRSRKGKKGAPEDEELHGMCRLFDVVKVDVEEKASKVKPKDTALEDHQMMSQFLPLLRDMLPTAAVEIEDDIHDYMSKQDNYVYDFYAVNYDAYDPEAESSSQYPLVQVDDEDDYHDGLDDSEYESDDSNAENNPLNDYPEVEMSEEDEVTSRSSVEESESESRTSLNLSQELESGSRESENEDSETADWLDDNWFDDRNRSLIYEDSEDVEIRNDESGDDEWS